MQLEPWCTFLLEKLNNFSVSQEMSASYATRRFVTLLTTAPFVSVLSQIPSVHVVLPTYFFYICFNIIPHAGLGSPSLLLPSGLPTKTLPLFLFSPLSHLNLITTTITIKRLITQSPLSHYFLPLRQNVPLSASFSKTLSLCSSFNV
jgi:hypothetical protein